jgi:hypothetical protein
MRIHISCRAEARYDKLAANELAFVEFAPIRLRLRVRDTTADLMMVLPDGLDYTQP